MSERDDILRELQQVADQGLEDSLTETGRTLFDAAVRDGLIKELPLLSPVGSSATTRLQENFPEVEPAVGMPTNPVDAQAWIDQLTSDPMLRPRTDGQGFGAKYSGAKITEDRYGQPVVETGSGEKRYLNRAGLSVGDIPRAVDATLGVVKEVAPYLTGGPIQGMVRSAAYQGGVGLATEGLKQGEKAILGEDVDVYQIGKTPMFAIAGDILGRGAFKLASKVYSSVVGRQAANIIDETTGQIKPEAVNKMRSIVTAEEADDLAFMALMDEVEAGSLTPEQMLKFSSSMDKWVESGQATAAQIERYNLFNRLGIQPTRAQITRTASDFQKQQELSKTSGKVLSALEQQQVQLGKSFEAVETGTGGVIRSESAPIQQAVIDKATRLDTEINVLYKSADEAAGGAKKAVDIADYLNKLGTLKGLNQRSGGTYKALLAQVEDMGFKIVKGKVVINGPALVSAKQAEQLRQGTNSLHAGANPIAKGMIRESKEVLDLGVARSLGRDAYKTARAAYASFRQGLNPEQLSKFSRNNKSLIRDLLEEKIPGERVFDRVIAGVGYTAKDLRALKNYVVGSGDNVSSAGAQAWADLRAETINYMRKAAFGGPKGELGSQTLTRTRLQRAIDKIGMEKLKIIFNAEEIKFIDDMLRLSSAIEPVGGTALGLGPSGQVAEKIAAAISAATGGVSTLLVNFARSFGNVGLRTMAESRALTPLATIATPTARELSRQAAIAARLSPETIGRAGATSAGAAVSVNEELR